MKNADMPAMPHSEEGYYANPKKGTGFTAFTGLTKREHFAAMAMQGALSNTTAVLAKDYQVKNWSEAAAVVAVKCADALLAELEADQ